MGPALLGLLASCVCHAAAEAVPALKIIPSGDGEVDRFVAANHEPKHAVATAVVKKGGVRHKLLEELAADVELSQLVVIGAQFEAGSPGQMQMHAYSYAPTYYGGKWTRTAVRAWLRDASYPLVNRMTHQFAAGKYFGVQGIGAVIVVKDMALQSDELVKALEPHATRLPHLKFTFFTKLVGTEPICKSFGVLSNDELLVLEDPSGTQAPRAHSNFPPPPMYRLVGVTPSSVAEFFEGYGRGTWPRYFRSTIRPHTEPLFLNDGAVRQLTSWDFDSAVADTSRSLLVLFVSADCDNCDEFQPAFLEVARTVQRYKASKRSGLYGKLLIATLDQSANEHSEIVKGTPWMRYWPRGPKRRPSDVELRSVDSILEYLEEHLQAEAEEFCPAVGCDAESSPSETPATKRVSLSPPTATGTPAKGYLSQDAATPRTKAATPQAAAKAPPRSTTLAPATPKARGYLSTSADLPDDEF